MALYGNIWPFFSYFCINFFLTFADRRIGKRVGLDRQVDSTPAAPCCEGGIWNLIDQSIKERTVSVLDQDATSGLHPQLKAYFSNPTVSKEKNPNPLNAWQQMKVGLHYVYELAMEFLPIIPTSTPCERLFSHAGHVLTQWRSRLSPSHVNMFVFLRSISEKDWF